MNPSLLIQAPILPRNSTGGAWPGLQSIGPERVSASHPKRGEESQVLGFSGFGGLMAVEESGGFRKWGCAQRLWKFRGFWVLGRWAVSPKALHCFRG